MGALLEGLRKEQQTQSGGLLEGLRKRYSRPSFDPEARMADLDRATARSMIATPEAMASQVPVLPKSQAPAGPQIAASPPRLRDMAERTGKVAFNRFIHEPMKPDYYTTQEMVDHLGRARIAAEEDFYKWLHANVTEEQYKADSDKYIKAFHQMQAAYEQAAAKQLSEGPGFVFDVMPAMSGREVAADVGVGLADFVGKMLIARKMIGSVPGKPVLQQTSQGLRTSPMVNPMIWEAVNQAEGGTPGAGMAMGGTLQAVGAVSGGNRLVQTGLTSALFGGKTAIEGGSTEDILISAGLPIVMEAVGAGKNLLTRQQVNAGVSKWRRAAGAQGIDTSSISDAEVAKIIRGVDQARWWKKQYEAGKVSEETYNKRTQIVLDSIVEPLDRAAKANKAAQQQRAARPKLPEKGTFAPSSEWQEVPEGATVPPGGEIRMNMQTGKTEARWPVPQATRPAPAAKEPDPTIIPPAPKPAQAKPQAPSQAQADAELEKVVTGQNLSSPEKPAVVSPAAAGSEGREPWQMTQEEYIQDDEQFRIRSQKQIDDIEARVKALKQRRPQYDTGTAEREALEAEIAASEFLLENSVISNAPGARRLVHKYFVKAATLRGENVSAEVLAEYPELTKPDQSGTVTDMTGDSASRDIAPQDNAGGKGVLAQDQISAINALAESRYTSTRKPSRPQTVFRGIKQEKGIGGASYGKGLYTAGNKKDAAEFGEVVELGPESLPQNPMIFDTVGKFNEFIAEAYSQLGYRRISEFNKDFPDLATFIQQLGNYDGVQIGHGTDAWFVKYPPITKKDGNRIIGERYNIDAGYDFTISDVRIANLGKTQSIAQRKTGKPYVSNKWGIDIIDENGDIATTVPIGSKAKAIQEANALKSSFNPPAGQQRPGTQEKSVHDYSNTQIALPAEQAAKLIEFGRSIPDAELYVDPKDDSYGRETEPHITVRYGLDTNDPARLRKAFEGFGPIRATMGKVSIFETDKYDVVKVDIESPELVKANKLVGQAEKVPGETHKDYKPHATIAYVKKGEGKKYVGNTALEGEEITVDRIELRDKNDKGHVIELGGQRPGDSTPATPIKETPDAVPQEVQGQEAAKVEGQAAEGTQTVLPPAIEAAKQEALTAARANVREN
jgi:2'-5' RNA ligase